VLSDRASWDDVATALSSEREFLRAFVARQGMQTNEVQRAWALLPVFLLAARRLRAGAVDLVELGSSAGLNLVWDRYGYRYAAGRWGAAGARLELVGDERGQVPADLLATRLRVRSRTGIDRSPIDPTTVEGARLLRSYVWPDQRERLERLDRAIESAADDPPPLLGGAAEDVLPEVLLGEPDDVPTIVFETAVLDFLSEAARRRVLDALEEAGQRRPLAFVSAGEPLLDERCWGLWLTVWPGGRADVVAHADYHGAWLDWRS
jgi:hypothetical protein